MDAELRRAWRRAGIKAGGGLLGLAGLVGLRLISAVPAGLEADLAELEAVEAELYVASKAASAPASTTRTPEATGASTLERLWAAAPPGSDPDRLVSCRLAGVVQFTRAADCLARGGESRDLSPRD
jgi:hypothetical protein